MSNHTPFFRDAESGVPCPRRDNLMCSIVDRDHMHKAIHMDAPALVSAEREADRLAEARRIAGLIRTLGGHRRYNAAEVHAIIAALTKARR